MNPSRSQTTDRNSRNVYSRDYRVGYVISTRAVLKCSFIWSPWVHCIRRRPGARSFVRIRRGEGLVSQGLRTVLGYHGSLLLEDKTTGLDDPLPSLKNHPYRGGRPSSSVPVPGLREDRFQEEGIVPDPGDPTPREEGPFDPRVPVPVSVPSSEVKTVPEDRPFAPSSMETKE